MYHTSLPTTLAARFVLVFLFGILTNRLRTSPLVGHLLAGVLVESFIPGCVVDQALSQEIVGLGVILLVSGVGLHFSPKNLLSVRAIAIPRALAQIGITALLGIDLAKLFSRGFGGGPVFGLSLSVASTVALLRILEQRQLLDTKRSRIAIGQLIVEDLAMVLTLVLLLALTDTLGGKIDNGEAGLLWPLLITLGKVTALIALMTSDDRQVVPWVLERITASGSRGLFILTVLAIALDIAYGSTMLLGVSFVLGTFFAGMILSGSEPSHEAAEDSLPLRDAFAMLFFVLVGILFNPMILLQELLTVLATFLVIVFSRSVAVHLIVRVFGHLNNTVLVIAASLTQIGEFSLILIGLGIGLELVPEQNRDLAPARTILSILVSPLLFITIDRLQQRKEQRPAETTGRAREMPAQDLSPPILRYEHTVLIGHGRVGGSVSAHLHATGTPFVVVVDKRDKADELREQGYSVALGNVASSGMLELANIAKACQLLITTPNGSEAGQIVDHARAVNPPLDIVAWVHFDAEVDYLEQNGINLVIISEHEIACGMVHRLGLDRDERDADAPLPQSA